MTVETGEPVRIRNAADLFSVLSTGPVEARVAVLQSIVNDPEKPVGLGPHNGEDFIDLLLRLIRLSSGGLRRLMLLCLATYQDPRTSEFMIREFRRSKDAKSVLYLARRLAVETDGGFFRPYLWFEGPEQALAAARYCSELEGLTTEEKLRVAILLDREFEPPPVSPQTLDFWLKELQGGYRLATRRLAESRGDEVLQLWQRYSDLAPAEQHWLLGLTAKLSPATLQARLPDLLQDPNVSFPVVEQALLHEVPLPPTLLQSKDPSVRAAGVSVGLADQELETYLSPQASVAEAMAAAGRCDLPRLLSLLQDRRWQVRAAVTNLISDHPEPPTEELRRRVASDFMGERVAAVEILRRLGDVEWLEQNVGPTVDPSSE